jgi:hypothetical protein
MSDTKNTGMSLTGILLIVFLVLKLTHNIDWSWWWVLSPLWIPIAMVILFTILLKIFF